MTHRKKKTKTDGLIAKNGKQKNLKCRIATPGFCLQLERTRLHINSTQTSE